MGGFPSLSYPLIGQGKVDGTAEPLARPFAYVPISVAMTDEQDSDHVAPPQGSGDIVA